MTSLIFGYGMTGQSFDRYLTKNGVKFDIYDVKHVEHPNAFSKLPSKEKLQSYEMVYISPGINILELYFLFIIEIILYDELTERGRQYQGK